MKQVSAESFGTRDKGLNPGLALGWSHPMFGWIKCIDNLSQEEISQDCSVILSHLEVYVVDDSVKFKEAAKHGNLIPLYRSIFSDHLTPVLAYHCLVKEDDRKAPSFLFESVELGLKFLMLTEEFVEYPMINPRKIMEKWKPQCIDKLPEAFYEQKHALLTKIASVREVVMGAPLRIVLKQLVIRTVPSDLGKPIALVHCLGESFFHVSQVRVKKPAGTAEEIEKQFGCESSRLIMVGDRPFTDIVYGNRNGFLTILTEPLRCAEEPLIVQQAPLAQSAIKLSGCSQLNCLPATVALLALSIRDKSLVVAVESTSYSPLLD
ncbi:hypothetical protein FXO37_10042 [Capsicum annuum]|nr:hypothetical protein FXO37_10042 [Capsicum annuum]